jgi:CRISPR-associated RAMP protein (TIGR02581 family)
MTTEPMQNFEKLESRYHLTGILEIRHATHVGCGEGDDKVDSIFITTKDGAHFIPGSSLRGALRSVSERLVASLNLDTCLLGQGNGSQCPTGNEMVKKKFREMVEKNTAEKALFDFLKKKLCLTCQVFGSPFMASRVRLGDLLPEKNGKPKGLVRWGVGIDRDTETAATGVLFSYEVVEKGEKLDFEIWAENMREQDWGILGLGLMEMLTGNFWVGAKSAAGLGQCRLEENLLKLEYFTGKEGLVSYLKTRDFPMVKEGPAVKKFFQDMISKLLNNSEPAKAGG